MVKRCPICRKLYPQHRVSCGYCERKQGVQEAPPSRRPAQVVEEEFFAIEEISEVSSEEEGELVFTEIPKSAGKGAAGTWTPEEGGTCNNCGGYNPSNHVFCSTCEQMLIPSSELVKQVVSSYPLKELKGLATPFLKKLRSLKIRQTEDLLSVCCKKHSRGLLAKKVGMPDGMLLPLVYQSDLCRIPDIDPEKALMLHIIGIKDIQHLLAYAPDAVFHDIQKKKMDINAQGVAVLPTQQQLFKWFEQADSIFPITIEA